MTLPRKRKCVAIPSSNNDFANALREVLGLDPLFFDGVYRKRAPGVSVEADEARRFFRAPLNFGNARVDAGGRARRHGG